MTTVDFDARRAAAPGTDPLAAVRAALLARAIADAQRTLADADADVASMISLAEERVSRILKAAGAEVAAETAVIAGEASARARRQGRAILLGAQRTAYERFRTDAGSAVRGLRSDPGYQPMLARLTALARERLGPGTVAREHPSGGIVAENAGRRLSLTLDAAAAHAVGELDAEVQRLWQP